MKIENFIYSKPNALSDEVCDALIQESVRIGSQVTREKNGGEFGDAQFRNGKLGRNDHQIYMPQQSMFMFEEIMDCIFNGLKEYEHIISSVKMQNLISPVCKLQHTPIGGGFHEWHCEQAGGNSAARSLAWMIYLNDVQEGGDTEFLYQHMKVKAEKGTLAIWPAGITHPHRGNPPYSNDKWVVTGWFQVPVHQVYEEAVSYFKANAQGG